MIMTTTTTALDTNTLAIWEEWNFDQDEVGDWIAIGFTDPVEAGEWYNAGFRVASEAAEWRKAGFVAEDAAAWEDVWPITPGETAKWVEAGFDYRDGWEWGDAGFAGDELDEVLAWCDAGFDTPAKAREWREYYEFAPLEAKSWRDAGYEVEYAYAWRSAGFTQAEADEWYAAGFRDVGEAVDWFNACLTPKAAAAAKEAGQEAPGEAE
ncbi:hypothetical protein DesfrDRAFT_2481 [Solidesulfovibrio fructosivorans JJ]]|uniref:Uncharacterized protein n=1 Tax=Solidesulfovibrio fructosivorans JJ] TaxID=596151 RepID=E1JXY2_SOLFR|nr:hypothetical protein [Solidesulfovibrio fructosivorans]EFL50720.1 hypothetical protein DesfrDRAFT_2481 [Solidesulfovibrio fructosivorans JJ]]